MESVENSKSEFPTLSTGLGNPAKTKAPDFHISTRRRRFIPSQKNKNEPENKFQLTDLGQFKHDKNASVASLRS